MPVARSGVSQRQAAVAIRGSPRASAAVASPTAGRGPRSPRRTTSTSASTLRSRSRRSPRRSGVIPATQTDQRPVTDTYIRHDPSVAIGIAGSRRTLTIALPGNAIVMRLAPLWGAAPLRSRDCTTLRGHRHPPRALLLPGTRGRLLTGPLESCQLAPPVVAHSERFAAGRRPPVSTLGCGVASDGLPSSAARSARSGSLR